MIRPLRLREIEHMPAGSSGITSPPPREQETFRYHGRLNRLAFNVG